MEQSNNDHILGTVSNDNSIWTADGCQQQLASTNLSKPGNISLFDKLPRKRLESYLTFSLLGVFLLLLALVVMIYLVINASVMFTKVCYSTKCVRSAANLLESMDTTTNPCDNFFTYACGKWETNHAGPDPDGQDSWISDRLAIQNRDVIQFLSKKDADGDPQGVKDARKVFQACLDIDAQGGRAIELLLELLDKIGLPRNPLNQAANTTPWIKILARTKRYLAMNLFISTGVGPSVANSTSNRLILETTHSGQFLPKWNMGRRKFNSGWKKLRAEEEQGLDTTIGIRMKFVSQLISYLIKETGEAFEESDVVAASENIMNITKNLSALEESENVSGSSLNEVPIEITLEDLQSLINNGTATGESKLDLAEYFTTLFDSLSESKPDFAEDEVLVKTKAYFPLLSKYLETLEDRDINLYIWWNVVYSLADHTNDDLRKLKENLDRHKFTLNSPSQTRAEVCMQTVNQLMSPAVGYFIAQKFEESRINEVYSMINNIRDTFISYINIIEWMDPETKRATIDKLKNINVFVGLPEWMKNRTKFEGLYLDVALTEESHFENIINLLESMTIADLELLGRTNDRNVGDFNPLDINASYDQRLNNIFVLYGMLRFPFYDLGIEALNYGAIGTLLGHELTHALDNTGRKYDKYGNLHQWWSNQSIEKYNNRTACFEKQYSNFILTNVTTPIMKVNGELTLGENLADDGGLKFGLYAYRSYVATHGLEAKLPGLQTFTHDQLFFLSFANSWCSGFPPKISYLQLAHKDVHSPEFVRVLGVLQNSPEFSEAWKCPRGSYMNPVHKCKLWID